MNRRITLLALLTASGLMASCDKKERTSTVTHADGTTSQVKTVSINQKGSDTMVQIAQAWAEAFHKKNPGITVNVSGGGSGTGIAALLNGTIEICSSSRDMKPKEKEDIKAKFGKDVTEVVVAYDALAVYTNTANPLKQISIEELQGIYAEGGPTNDWEQITPDFKGQIVRVSRASSSGTYEFFREAVCGKKADGKTYNEFKQGSSELSGSAEVVEFTSKTPTAVGYSGMGYKTDHVNWLAVSKKKGEAAVLPGVDVAKDGRYPLARKLYLYVVGEPSAAAKEYIDWILTPEGQAIVAKEHFVPVN